MNLIEVHAKELGNTPEGWAASQFICRPLEQLPTLYYELRGAVFPPVTRGKRKGRPNYDHPKPGTNQTVIVPCSDHEAWLAEWERKTGQCQQCTGSGKTMASCSAKETTYRPCSRCGGTGKAKGAQ